MSMSNDDDSDVEIVFESIRANRVRSPSPGLDKESTGHSDDSDLIKEAVKRNDALLSEIILSDDSDSENESQSNIDQIFKRNRGNIKEYDTDDDDEDDENNAEEEEAIANLMDSHLGGLGNFESDIPLTPFNLKEELEEGRFDPEGTYHWNKTQTVRDIWLENVDWVKVKRGELRYANLVSDNADDSTGGFDAVAAYKKMLEYMKPGETVSAALRRLGGNRLSTAEKLKLKKSGQSTSDEDERARNVTFFTEQANLILSEAGNLDIYEETFEQIAQRMCEEAGSSETIVISSEDDVKIIDDDVKIIEEVKTLEEELRDFNESHEDCEVVEGPSSENHKTSESDADKSSEKNSEATENNSEASVKDSEASVKNSKATARKAAELDMYSDDFNDKEKERLDGEPLCKKPRITDDIDDPTSSSVVSSSTSLPESIVLLSPGEVNNGDDGEAEVA